ncbi:hypothetical protein ACIBG8_46640 [Nonomuraea sp. NPDC050556]|uniref:hypothetical protein n=1 Tax=Nonomuraea sp. NPDC050556 TaxID=3364369 RepID=UPI00379E678F
MHVDARVVDNGPLNYPQQEWLRGVDLAAAERGLDNVLVDLNAGPGRTELLLEGLVRCINRHETLRTRYAFAGGIMLSGSQLVLAPALDLRSLMLQVADVRDDPDAASRPFNLTGEVPIRVRVVSSDPDRSRVVLVADHVVTDYWGAQVIRAEVETYAAEGDTRAVRSRWASHVVSSQGTPPLQPLQVARIERAPAFPAEASLGRLREVVRAIQSSIEVGGRHLAAFGNQDRDGSIPTVSLHLVSADLARNVLAAADKYRAPAGAVYLSLVRIAQFCAFGADRYAPNVICSNRVLARARIAAGKMYLPTMVHTSLRPADRWGEVLNSSHVCLLRAQRSCHTPIAEMSAILRGGLTEGMTDNFLNIVIAETERGPLAALDSAPALFHGGERLHGRRLAIEVFHSAADTMVRLRYRKDLFNLDRARLFLSMLDSLATAVVGEDRTHCSVAGLSLAVPPKAMPLASET